MTATVITSSHHQTDDRTGDLRRAALAGATAMLPWLAGIVPFGLVIGVTIADSAIPTVAGFLTAPLIYGGSAQLAAIEMLDAGSLPALVVVTVVAINVRLVLYGGSIAPHWSGTSRRWRAFAAYMLVDPTYAIGMRSYGERGGREGHVHYAAAAIVLWVAWISATLTGIALGSAVPAGLHLQHIVPIYLVAHVASGERDRPFAVAAITGAAMGAITAPVPLHVAPAAAIAVGVAAGMVVARRPASQGGRS